MKYHPIIFRSEMVRAILDGHKTQTRRIIKPQPELLDTTHPSHGLLDTFIYKQEKYDGSDFIAECCPYGQVGDRLWVRETFMIGADKTIYYRANDNDLVTKWSPPIYMPRWASRITLEIIGIRIERVQEISLKDCLAEGYFYGWDNGSNSIVYFQELWNSINAKRGYSWESNPYVWVLEFRRVQ
jgi:hypothetical protein